MGKGLGFHHGGNFIRTDMAGRKHGIGLGDLRKDNFQFRDDFSGADHDDPIAVAFRSAVVGGVERGQPNNLRALFNGGGNGVGVQAADGPVEDQTTENL